MEWKTLLLLLVWIHTLLNLQKLLGYAGWSITSSPGASVPSSDVPAALVCNCLGREDNTLLQGDKSGCGQVGKHWRHGKVGGDHVSKPTYGNPRCLVC